MKTLRAQLILSHVLPLLFLLPLLIALLLYILETQVLLADLKAELANQAVILAQSAQFRAVVFQDRTEAQLFLENAARDLNTDVALYNVNSAEWVALFNPQSSPDAPTQNELAALASGETLLRADYNIDPAQIDAQAFAPVLNAQQELVGIMRVQARIEQVSARFTQLRALVIGSAFFATLVAVAIGAWVGARTARRLNAVTQAITRVASSDAPIVPAQNMPQEFRATFDAVSALRARLLASEVARKRLLANLVHELGRPLAALQAAIRALRQGADRDDALRQELLLGMDEQLERLRPLLDNLAGLHGELTGALELHRAPLALSEWLPKTVALWRHAAEQKQLTWHQEIPADLPSINADADKLAQVLGNLLSNACKYTPEGGEIFLRAGADAREIWIAVQDTGVGIAPEDVPHIFDPLYRGSTAPFGGSNRFPQGMGLGLAIARDIVNAHGGRIEVESEIGKGSCFKVRLPI